MTDDIQEPQVLEDEIVSDPVGDICEPDFSVIDVILAQQPIISTSFEQMYEDLEAKLNEIGKVEHFYYVHKLKDECLELVAKIKKAAHIG